MRVLPVNVGPKTEVAKQAIIRHIQESGLQPGDRLPSQEEFKDRLGLSGTTVIRAINRLKADGLIESRDKVGVFLRSNDLTGKVGRTVAMLPFFEDEGISPFYTSLALRIQYALRRESSQTLFFPCRHLTWMEDFSLWDFPGLVEAVDTGQVNAVMDLTGLHGRSLAHLARRSLPVTYVGAPYAVPHGLIIDLPDYCREALELLFARGCRRPAVVAPRNYIRDSLLAVMARVFARHGHERPPADAYFECDFIPEGRRIAKRLLALSRDERPDGLVMIDEFIGHDLLVGLGILERGRAGYRPDVVMARNSRMQIAPPRDDVLFFDKDIDRIAEMAVRHLLDQNGGARKPALTRYRMRPAPPEPFFAAAEAEPGRRPLPANARPSEPAEGVVRP